MEKICFISDGEIKFKQTKMVMQLVVCNPFCFFNEKLRDIDGNIDKHGIYIYEKNT